MAGILVVDDDGHIREVVRYALEKAGFHVTEASDGAAALRASRECHPDLVVLDIIMPGEDGLEVCRRLSAGGSKVPIIFLTSRDEEVDRVLGLELGADDYVTKPFSPRELVARVRAVLRRTSTPAEAGKPPQRLSHGGLVIDTERHRATCQSREIDLTMTEFAILGTLMGMPGKAYSRAELVDRAYGHDHCITERTIDTHIRRIRAKLEGLGSGDVIETVHGLGYRMRT